MANESHGFTPAAAVAHLLTVHHGDPGNAPKTSETPHFVATEWQQEFSVLMRRSPSQSDEPRARDGDRGAVRRRSDVPAGSRPSFVACRPLEPP
jgi:hypothetical protein